MPRLDLPYGFKDPVKIQKLLQTQPEEMWIKRGERRALRLFHAMAERVPAYKDFLQKNKLNPRHIRSIKDFGRIPPIDKDNYLRQYPRKMLVWDGELKKRSWVISTTSGSTGKPYYFPRQASQDWQYEVLAELYLRSNFNIQDKSTLYIVAFPMGAWIGGVFTYEALKLVAQRGRYNLSIITPGIHKQEILNAVKELGGDFDQILIGAYAPFLKDFLDDGERAGIDWRDYNLGFIFSAEAFSEKFRDYVIKKTGAKNEYEFSLNHYGTVDLGTMSHETPLCILMRRQAVKDEAIYHQLFKQTTKLPTLTQYIPELFYFEDIEGNLFCTAHSGIPLVRYDLKDHGGVFTLKNIKNELQTQNFDIAKEAERAGITDTIWNLPFVYVYERSDLSVSFYAFQIYPEMIKHALQDESLEKLVTGKFTMEVNYDDDGQQNLDIHVELKGDVLESEKLHNHVQTLITKTLLDKSSEYRETHKHYAEKVYPRITFWPYEDETYFRAGAKQKWVKK